MECALIRFAGEIKWGQIHMVEGRMAIQRTLDRLEELAKRNILRFKMNKFQLLELGRESLR